MENLKMKVLILFVIIVLLMSCSTTQSIKQNSQGETTSNNSDQSKEYKFAGSIGEEEPYVIRRYPLEYPRFAKNNRIDGTVILQVEVFTDGTVGHIEVIQSVMSDPCVLSEAAINSVKKWKFSPAKKDGKPIACWATIPVEFKLK